MQLFALKEQKNIETYPYAIDKKYDGFETRNYEASLFTSVKLSGNKYKDESGKGFSILAGYIFGGNKENEKIAMTSPWLWKFTNIDNETSPKHSCNEIGKRQRGNQGPLVL